MAESFIFSIAESLAAKLASRAYQEASRLVGVYDDLQELKTSLSYVKAVLLDAEQKQEHNHELREWLKQIKLIFYDAENFLDEVDCETLSKQVVRDYGTPKDKVGRFFSSSNPLVFRYKLGHQIKEIKKRLDRVAADRNKFGLQVIDVDRRGVHRREMTYSHVVESKVVGREHDKEMIMKLLMEPSLDDNGGSKHISVIPIVGIGGLGKTTLARLVYMHDLAVYVAKDVCQLVSSNTQDISENVLHLSFVENGLRCNSIKPSLQGARSILFPVNEVGASEAFLNAWVSNCKYLRYLDLSDSTCETLPQSISKLKHLRSISLCNNTRIKRLPSSICKLQNLQVLRLDGCSNLETLPKKLRKLISLQRLEITTKQSILPESDIAKLNRLEYLCVQDCDNLESLFVETRLPTLRTLQVSGCANLKSLPLDTHHFPQLETLVIPGIANEDWLDRSEDTNAVLRLKSIYFYGMVTLPHSLQQYASTLQTLVIACFYELEVLPEWLWNLSSLKSLYISECPKLKSLPSDIHRLTSLQVLGIIKCRELYRKYEPQVGECWPMISHIKHTYIRDTWE
ncbi:hypothetical protein Ahy_B06g080250 [Arachis hypogaea]|uniref:Uncharacterized protein n=1 Tax=Arachis hypogaea TaxID=3818 RepID=A0A444YHH4_ARAHY|nr:hypothetical protein Ahy_B06g080250 [Arachis hypogaea]